MSENTKDQLDFLPPAPEGYDEAPMGRNLVYSRYMFVLVLAIAAVELVVVASIAVVEAQEVELEEPGVGSEERIVLEAFVAVESRAVVIQVAGL